MTSRHIARFIGCERGMTMVEFGMTLPLLVTFVLGVIWASLLAYSAASLHYAVEAGARCYSVASECATVSQAQTYAQTRYYGINRPTFTASIAPSGCHQLSATVNVAFSLPIASWTVPLSATACFP